MKCFSTGLIGEIILLKLEKKNIEKGPSVYIELVKTYRPSDPSDPRSESWFTHHAK